VSGRSPTFKVPQARPKEEEAVQGSGESCPFLLGMRRLRTRRFRSRGRSPGGPAWAEILAEPPTGGRGQEGWNNGTMEYWNDGLGDRPPSPVFHHSSIPPFHRNPQPEAAAGARFFQSLPGTQGLPEIFRAAYIAGSVPELMWGGRATLALSPEPPLLFALTRTMPSGGSPGSCEAA